MEGEMDPGKYALPALFCNFRILSYNEANVKQVINWALHFIAMLAMPGSWVIDILKRTKSRKKGQIRIFFFTYKCNLS